MFNLDDSLTEIDWLHSLRIKKTSENKDQQSILVNKLPQKTEGNSNTNHKISSFEKPSYSYAYLIKLAIESSKNKQMKLNEIYAWIMEKFPYYKYRQTDNSKGWKNAIRHNLSLNKVFKRCLKKSSEPGKGSYWTIDTDYGGNLIQNPPIKKMKTYYLCPVNDGKCIDTISDNLITAKNGDILRTSENIKISELSENEPSIHMNSDSCTSVDFIVSSCDITANKPDSTQSASSSYMLKPQIDKNNISTNSFSDRSAFVPYSTHNNNSRTSEICTSTCEISYSGCSKNRNFLLQTPSIAFSNYSQTRLMTDHLSLCELLRTRQTNDNLEIDEGEPGNENEDIILKTPTLCQINTSSDFKDQIEECFTTKCQRVGSFNRQSCETIFETNNFNDSFFSIHHSLDSEICDSKHIFKTLSSKPQEKISNHDASFSQNVVFTSRYQFNAINFENQILFEDSLGLTADSKKILFNTSGLRENYFNNSQWINLSQNIIHDCDTNNTSPHLSETFQTTNTYDIHNTIHDGIIPSQEFLEMKNHLRCYQFRDCSIAESNKPSSVSTSSTVKSTDTVHSKSPAFDRNADVVANNAISRNDVLIVMNQVSKSRFLEEDDEIDDCFNWSTFD